MKRTKSERFWRKVQKPGPLLCWNWKGATASGYGTFIDGPLRIGAHVFSYELENGTVPKGLCVLHDCDNTLCVNPWHLFLGTKKDNTQDMIMKGRHSHHERHGSAKLNLDIVRKCRSMYATGEMSILDISKEIKLSHAATWKMLTGKTWRISEC